MGAWEKLVLQRCHAINTEFAAPLPFTEVATTNQSVSRWIWRNFDVGRRREEGAQRPNLRQADELATGHTDAPSAAAKRAPQRPHPCPAAPGVGSAPSPRERAARRRWAPTNPGLRSYTLHRHRLRPRRPARLREALRPPGAHRHTRPDRRLAPPRPDHRCDHPGVLSGPSASTCGMPPPPPRPDSSPARPRSPPFGSTTPATPTLPLPCSPSSTCTTTAAAEVGWSPPDHW